MALSGIIDKSLTASQAVTQALKKIGILGQGFTASADEMSDAIEVLNQMLATWSTEGPNLWTRAEQTVTLITGTQTYTLSPRPRLVYNARWLVDGAERIPLTEWDHQDWDRFIYKTSTGEPKIYVLNKQRTSTTITLWPIPTFASGAQTLKVSYERSWEKVTDGSQDIDIPEEFIEAVVVCLAARLAEDYQLNTPTTQKVAERAATLYEQVMNFDRWGDTEFRVAR
jgi:hypothetical protein